ncbi:hypothetical protein ABZ807_27260 [Micromonospora sp. NPDC047548]|uniref:hypothetical protein n=1 Tax=Micromonospora sp. NPDC047548 TaxID=3155624 RepID=UPI0033DFB4EE
MTTIYTEPGSTAAADIAAQLAIMSLHNRGIRDQALAVGWTRCRKAVPDACGSGSR